MDRGWTTSPAAGPDGHFNFKRSLRCRPAAGAATLDRAFQSLLKASGRGLVVNAGSVAGIRGGGSNIAYAAA